jgi:hypothetical protein
MNIFARFWRAILWLFRDPPPAPAAAPVVEKVLASDKRQFGLG